jgi:hypothetical protein
VIKEGIEFVMSVRGKDVLPGIEQGTKRVTAATKEARTAGASWAVSWNQGLELAKKSLMAVRVALGATAGKALELRASTDPVRREMDAMAKATERAQVSIGNALLPAFGALAKGLTPLVSAFGDFVTRNRELVAIKTAQWAVMTGKALVTVLATSAKGAAEAVAGLRAIADGSKWGVEKGVNALARMSKAVVDLRDRIDGAGASRLSRALGKVAADSERAGDALEGTIKRSSDELDNLKSSIDAAAVAAFEGFDLAEGSVRGLLDAHTQLGAEVRKSTADYQALRAAIAQSNDRIHAEATAKGIRGIRLQIAQNIRTLELQNKRIQVRDQLEQVAAERVANASRSASASLVSEFSSVIRGAQSADEAVGSLLGSLAELAAQKALESVVSGLFGFLTGGIGPTVLSFLGFARGGVVPGAGVLRKAAGGPMTGGVPGVDSIPALLTPGEVVIPAGQVRENLRSGRAPEDSRGGGGPSISVHIDASSRSFIPEAQGEFDRRIVRQLLPSLRRTLATGRGL